MKFEFENDYPEGSIMHDYHEAVAEDTFHSGLREALQAAAEVSSRNGSDIDRDAKLALWDAMDEIKRAANHQSNKILQDIAEERSEREALQADD